MSNLGFQTVYRLFNAVDDVVCERVFLPPRPQVQDLLARGTRLVSLESQTPLHDFDVLAFSVSFEWDYPNVVSMLRLAGLPFYASDRTDRHPLIVIGGAVTFVNPEPLAPFADVIAAGEGEIARARSGRGGRDRGGSPRRADGPGLAPRLLHPLVLRRGLRRGRPASVDGAQAGHRCAEGRTQGGRQDHGFARPPAHEHLHARHRVRFALPRRGGARLRQPLPVLLGGLQLSAGSSISRGSHPRARHRQRVRMRIGPDWSRLRSAITRRSSAS